MSNRPKLITRCEPNLSEINPTAGDEIPIISTLIPNKIPISFGVADKRDCKSSGSVGSSNEIEVDPRKTAIKSPLKMRDLRMVPNPISL